MATVSFSPAGDVLYAYLAGEIDHDAAQSLRIQLDDALVSRAPQTMILDFGGVGFMDSSGVGLILGRQRIARTGHGTAGAAHTVPAGKGAAAGAHPLHGCRTEGGINHESGKHNKDPVRFPQRERKLRPGRSGGLSGSV